MAQWLLLQKRTSGAPMTAAKFAPSWNDPSDLALAVVHDRALVVGSEQDERPVQLEEIGLLEALHLAVRNPLAVSDHAPQLVLGRKNLRHLRQCMPRLDPRPPQDLAVRAGRLRRVTRVLLRRRRDRARLRRLRLPGRVAARAAGLPRLLGPLGRRLVRGDRRPRLLQPRLDVVLPALPAARQVRRLPPRGHRLLGRNRLGPMPARHALLPLRAGGGALRRAGRACDDPRLRLLPLGLLHERRLQRVRLPRRDNRDDLGASGPQALPARLPLRLLRAGGAERRRLPARPAALRALLAPPDSALGRSARAGGKPRRPRRVHALPGQGPRRPALLRGRAARDVGPGADEPEPPHAQGLA